MSDTDLHRQIIAMTDALSGVTAVDRSTRALLSELKTQVARLTDYHGDGSVTDRLEELAVRFENDHPAAGTALRQAIDALVKAGI